MAEPPLHHKSLEGLRSGEGSVAYLEQALWRQMSDATDAAEFCQSWLVLQSRIIGGVANGMVVLGPPRKRAFYSCHCLAPG